MSWMDKYRKDPKFTEKLRGKAKTAAQAERLPPISFPIDIPIFIRTLEESRKTPSRWGERELFNVEVIEDTDPAFQKGSRWSMWVTQQVIISKMEQFRDKSLGDLELEWEDKETGDKKVSLRRGKIPEGLELFVMNLGKVRGASYGYFDYVILTAEEGRKVLDEV